MNNQDALKNSLSCFKNNDIFESFSRSTLLDLRAQRAVAHKTRKNNTHHPIAQHEGPLKRILYLTWFINEDECDNEEFIERVPDKFKALKQRVESHVKKYYPVCMLADDYWQMDLEVNAEPSYPPVDCSIYTTEGVYIRVAFSFRSM